MREGIITLEKREAAHAAVLRQKAGYETVVSLGDGYDYKGKIISLDRNGMTVEVAEKVKNDRETSCRFTLYQCAAKASDFILQKAVELGFSEFVTVESSRSNAKVNSERMNSVSVDAAKQCGRAVIPAIRKLSSVRDTAKELSGYDIAVFPYENAKDGSIADIDFSGAKKVAVIIGAEGGFTDEEAEILKSSGAKCVTLGKRILRAETAAVAAMTLVLEYSGELK